MLHFKELKVGMHHLELKEKDLNNELKLHKMEEETKRQLSLKEVELKQSTPSAAYMSHDRFDLDKHIRLIPPFNNKDIDKLISCKFVANSFK